MAAYPLDGHGTNDVSPPVAVSQLLAFALNWGRGLSNDARLFVEYLGLEIPAPLWYCPL